MEEAGPVDRDQGLGSLQVHSFCAWIIRQMFLDPGMARADCKKVRRQRVVAPALSGHLEGEELGAEGVARC